MLHTSHHNNMARLVVTSFNMLRKSKVVRSEEPEVVTISSIFRQTYGHHHRGRIQTI